MHLARQRFSLDKNKAGIGTTRPETNAVWLFYVHQNRAARREARVLASVWDSPGCLSDSGMR